MTHHDTQRVLGVGSDESLRVGDTLSSREIAVAAWDAATKEAKAQSDRLRAVAVELLASLKDAVEFVCPDVDDVIREFSDFDDTESYSRNRNRKMSELYSRLLDVIARSTAALNPTAEA